MKLAVVCWLWHGWRPVYDYRHVNALQRMVKKYLTIPHEFICITDDKDYRISAEQVLFSDLPTVPECPMSNGYPNCFRRLTIFSAGAHRQIGADRVLSLDLDCVIFRNIDHLITKDKFIAAAEINNRYCGSVFSFDLGSMTEIFQDFSSRQGKRLESKRRGSDQAWMSDQIPFGATYPENEVRVIREWYQPEEPREAVLVTPGDMKPWSQKMAMKHREVFKEYMQYMR